MMEVDGEHEDAATPAYRSYTLFGESPSFGAGRPGSFCLRYHVLAWHLLRLSLKSMQKA
jgi:hypothetical protein